MPSAVADAGVDHDVDQVHHEECHDRQNGEQNNVEKDDRIVAGHDRLGHQVADAGPRKDDLHDHDRPDEVRQR